MLFLFFLLFLLLIFCLNKLLLNSLIFRWRECIWLLFIWFGISLLFQNFNFLWVGSYDDISFLFQIWLIGTGALLFLLDSLLLMSLNNIRLFINTVLFLCLCIYFCHTIRRVIWVVLLVSHYFLSGRVINNIKNDAKKYLLLN